MFKGIVFDLDGTLVDSPLCFATIRRELGIPESEYILEFLQRLPPEIRAQKMEQLERIEVEVAAQAVPFVGVPELLREIRNREIKLGLFTRNCRSAADRILECHGLQMDDVITRDDAPAKPNPEGLRIFLSRWNLYNPGQLLFVGDFRFDIECGKRAGVKTALFTNRKKPAETWDSDFLISDYFRFWDNIDSFTVADTPGNQS